MTLGIEQNIDKGYAINWNKLIPQEASIPTIFSENITPPVAPTAPQGYTFFEALGEQMKMFMENMQNQIENMFPKVIAFPNHTPLEPIVLQPGNNYNLPKEANACFNKFMQFVFEDEGAYVNNPDDPGGHTNMGIRKDYYEKIMGPISLQDFKNLTKEQAKEYYYKFYWIPSGAKAIAENGNAKLAYTLLDTAIHHGVHKAKNLLNKSNGDADKLIDQRLAVLQKSKNWVKFKRGWTNRLDKVESRIDKMPENINTIQDKILLMNA